MKLLWELKDRECHYAVKEDREVVGHFYFCADPNKAESSYCEKHDKLCATPPSQRRIARAY